uniref:Uncharacterized protein n=1 Tax=Macrostomum lignano TaxID=282301 RepID=A0A1I8J5U1_9PLAT
MSAVSLPSAAACARSDSLDLSNSSNEAIPNSDIEVASSLGGTSDREFSIGESWRTVDDGSSRDSQSRPDDRVPALTPRTLIESNSPATTANGTVVAEAVTDVFAEAPTVPTALIPEEKLPDKPEAEKTGAELPLRPRKRWRPRRRQPPVSSSRTAAGVPESAALTMPNSAATASESPVQRTVSELRSLALVGDAKLQHRTAIKEEQQQRNLQLAFSNSHNNCDCGETVEDPDDSRTHWICRPSDNPTAAAFRAAEVDARSSDSHESSSCSLKSNERQLASNNNEGFSSSPEAAGSGGSSSSG